MITIAWGEIELCRLVVDGVPTPVIGNQFQLREGTRTFDGIISKELTDEHTLDEYSLIADVFGIGRIAQFVAPTPVIIAALLDTEQADLAPHAPTILQLYRDFLGRARASDTAAS